MRRSPKSLLAVALLICLVSVLFASGVQGSFGRVKVSELRIVDAAGYEVSTLLYKPDNATASNPAPCILTVEGWFNNKEMQDLYSVEYARRGYVVVAVDMHGHGDSEATDANGLYEDAVGLDAAIRMAAELPYVDSARIGITGHSSGGAACAMALALDNERETPLVSAVLWEASTWVDDTGEDHAADIGERDAGIISDRYDEFFYWTDDMIVPREFLRSADAKNFVNFNNGSDGVADVVAGQYYKQGDAFRVIYQLNCTHPWVHFSKSAVACGVQFFQDAFGAPNPIGANNQVWQWKTFFNTTGLVSAVLSAIFLAVTLLDTDYFKMLKAEKEPKPLEVRTADDKKWFWIPLAVSALFSFCCYYVTVSLLYSITTKFFTQNGPLLMGTWSAVCGLFAILVMTVYYKSYGKAHKFDLRKRGVFMDAEKVGRTILLALISVSLTFFLLFFADYFFKTDFRIWVITLKAFEPDKVIIGLKYLPFFLLFYIANSVSTNCFNYNTVGGKYNTLLLAFFNELGALVFIAIQYLTFVSTGALAWYSAESWRISGIWLYPACVYLFLTPFITRYVYKKTNNPYLAAIINAIIITMMAVANTTTILGGGAVVASNY